MRILVIDDDKAITSYVAELLRQQGHEPVTFNTPKEAVTAFFNQHFDLIYLDIEMPDFNGFQVAERIRELEDSWTPIVLMSVLNKEEFFQKGINAGADFYLTKPISETIFLATLAGIERMHSMRSALEEAEEELHTIKTHSAEAFITVNKDEKIIDINPTACRIFGYQQAELLDQKITLLMNEGDAQQHQKHGLKPELRFNQKINLRSEVEGKHKDGRKISLLISITPIFRHRETLHTIILRDITNEKDRVEELNLKANFDNLTGLPNRELFYEHLNYSLKLSKRNKTRIGLFFIDLDRFKSINDLYGHDAGDMLLQSVTEKLKQSVRDSDTVCRLSGDEFTVILEELVDDLTPSQICKRIFQSFDKPIALGSNEVQVSVSIGIAFCDNGELSADNMVKQADMAMYQAKQSSNNSYHYFTSAMQEKNLYKEELLKSLSDAIESGELKIFYQPQIRLSNNSLYGAEALMRWDSRKYGKVSPLDFIPLLEDTGQIVKVTQWLIKTAFQQWADWISQQAISAEARLSINLSARDIKHPDLLDVIADAFEQTGLQHNRVTFEVTESLLLDNSEASLANLKQIRAAGSMVALDDFGTGYSSLSYISEMPIDKVKIDKSFIDKIPKSDRDRALVRSIIEMSQGLALTVIAEGIDTEHKRNFLLKNKCDIYQGFLYSPALPAEKFIDKISVKLES